VTDLITVGDVEIAIGRDLTAAETARVEQLISQVSSYIETRTGLAFEPFTDRTVRFQSDYTGTVDLSPGPATSVTSVTAVVTTGYFLPATGLSFGYDGFNTVYNLYPCQAVDIVYSGGLEEIPEDLAGVCLDGVLRKFLAGPAGATSGAISKKMVGGVAYEYAIDSRSFSDDSLAILDLYSSDEEYGTFYTGGRDFPGIWQDGVIP
jgi:hypothetical protein